ncbi:hypothetical protein TNCV_867121 [Trichonephila clavipes]|nr:hypothetical protein TNCV_867121 [Trichonephila clavipes]
MRLQKRKVDGYEWRCRNQSKDNRHDVVRSPHSHKGSQRLANQRLHLGRDEVSDWLDARHRLPWCECGFRVLAIYIYVRVNFGAHSPVGLKSPILE